MYLDVILVQSVKERAQALGIPISQLLETYIRHGFENVPDEKVLEISRAQPSRLGRLAGGLTSAQQRCLEAIDRLMTPDSETGMCPWRFDHADIAAQAGLLKKAAYLALKGLQSRGLVVGADSPETDRWGRPVDSYWRLPDGDQIAKSRHNQAKLKQWANMSEDQAR